LPYDLKHIKYFTLALGDSSYPFYCRAGKTMDTRRLGKMGGERILERVDVDQEEVTAIQKWASKVTDKLRSISPSIKQLEHDYLFEKQKLGLIKEKTIKIGKVKKKKPLSSRVSLVESLTLVDEKSDKETIHIEFDISNSGMTYECGGNFIFLDSLAVLPRNHPQETKLILDFFGKIT
jgi:sulfite reductase (NADPH) flavoprotein alpha-component